MKYTTITPDQVFQIITSLVNDSEFKNTIDEMDLSPDETIEVIENLFYELTREEGFSFRGMKKDDVNLFKGFLNMIIKTNINLLMSN
jgi:hypothetical protein